MLRVCTNKDRIINYQRKVNSMIPEAIRYTDSEVIESNFKNSDDYNNMWNKIYFRKMNKLTVSAGRYVED